MEVICSSILVFDLRSRFVEFMPSLWSMVLTQQHIALALHCSVVVVDNVGGNVEKSENTFGEIKYVEGENLISQLSDEDYIAQIRRVKMKKRI